MFSDNEKLAQVYTLEENTFLEYTENDSFYLYNQKVNSYAYLSDSAAEIVKHLDGKRSVKEITDLLTHDNATQQDYANVLKFILNQLIPQGFIKNEKTHATNQTTIQFTTLILKKKQVDRLSVYLAVFFNASFIRLFYLVVFLYTGYFLLSQNSFFIPDSTVNYPLLILLTVMVLLLHELGHCTALKRLGYSSQGIGFGVYLFTPVVYADVSKAWLLAHKKRVMVDLGGFHLQAITTFCYFLLAYYLQNYTVVLVLYFSLFLIFFNFNPFIKSDLYWAICDYYNLYDLHQRADHTLLAFIRNPKVKRLSKKLLLFAILRYLFLFFVLGIVLFLAFQAFKNLIQGNFEFSFWEIEKTLLSFISLFYLFFMIKQNISRKKCLK